MRLLILRDQQITEMAGRLEALFSRCDTSGRGWIELDEFKLICQDMGIGKVRGSQILAEYCML